MLFDQLGLIEPIMKALKAQGYTQPTPIQEQAMPVVLDRKDLLGCAQTGTGKTAAFAIPILQLFHLDEQNKRGYKHIRSLVLTPTRELAVQIHESFEAYGRYTTIRQEVIFGGVSQHTQTLALRNGTDVLIATPGRLLDLINQGYVHLDHLEIFVLDEADRMLDMGFIHDVKKIIRLLPKEKQTLFFSATMPPAISQLADSLLHQPVRVEVTPVSSTAEKIDQSVYFVNKKDKLSLLLHLLQEKNIRRTLVFTRTKHGADKITKELKKANVNAASIHGNKTQTARQYALNQFKSGRLTVLVATDIAARGIDVDELTHVINFDIPEVPETYVHRIGRTGRAGSEGTAFSFCDGEEMGSLKDINKLIGQKIPAETHPYELNLQSAAVHGPAPKRQSAPHRGHNQRKGSPRSFPASR
jgi:ATP-dependent RNA helicase RhlE